MSRQGAFVVTGTHDVDAGWIEALRARCGEGICPRIVPRLVLEAQPPAVRARRGARHAPLCSLSTHASTQAKEVAGLVQSLVALLQQHGFDGLVLEAGTGDRVHPVRPAAARSARCV